MDAWDGAGRGADADEPFLCDVALLQLVVQLLELRLQLGVVRHGIQIAGAGAGGQPVAARDISDKPRRGDAPRQRAQAQCSYFPRQGWMRRAESSLNRSQGCCVEKTRMYFEVRRRAQRRTSKASRNSGTLPSGTSTSSSALKTVKLLASGPSYQPCRSGSQPRIHWPHEACLGPEACLSMGL